MAADNLTAVETTLKSLGKDYKLREVDPNKLDIDSTVAKLGIKYREGQATLIYRVRGKEFIAVLRRDDTLFDLKKLKEALGTSRVSFATPEEIKELGFEPGLVTPILLKEKGIKTYADSKVLEMDKVVCGSGSENFALEIDRETLLATLPADYTKINISYANPDRQDEIAAGSANSGKKQPKVYADKELIARFLDRGVEGVFPTREVLEKKLFSGERLTAYMGFDPTGPYLHVGHAMGIRGLRILQQLGHRVIFLVGDYTARVGDPDKDTTRELLTAEKIASNMAGWKEQASQLIDFEDSENPVEWMHNFSWLSTLKLEDLIGLMSKMTVQQMLERDLFVKRIKENKPLQLQELIYPLMQGYDSVAMEVDLELGGTDQIFNMLVGRDLVKSYLGKEKFVRAHQMMPAPDGITMSKTKGNGINLSDDAHNMYGVAMSYADEHIVKGLELLTDTPDSEIAEISAAIAGGDNPMPYKKLMAYRIVELIKGGKAAAEAQEHFEATVQRKEVSRERTVISLTKLNAALTRMNKLGDIITIAAEVSNSSKSHVKQLLKQGGVELDGQRLNLDNPSVELKPGSILRLGKRDWYEFVE
jgi:tyrosyl-tRNA synthetase